MKSEATSSSSNNYNISRNCKICESRVRPRKNYTPNICEACQKFFRRNVGKWDELVCSSGQLKCSVENGRRWCSKCRFEKCLRFGMKSKFMKSGNEICENETGSMDNSNNQSLASSPLAVVAYQRQSPQRPSVELVPMNDGLAHIQVETAPFDYTFNAAERFLKTCLIAYTELSGIDRVCSLNLFFIS